MLSSFISDYDRLEILKWW